MDIGGAFSTRHVAPSDSRLLSNLIKAERNYITHLRASVNAAHGASSSLSAWGTSEAPDVADASARLANLLSACTDVQSTHVAAIEGYRAALKDVADREASIRTVFRDRDILVGRLIKASQKSANASSKKSPEERAEKVAKAQRELAACEEVLTVEEAALVGVKRRTFKEALTMRMKTMGDAGAAMVDAAKEAILLLDQFDSTAYQMPISPIEPYDESTLQHHPQEAIMQDNLHPYHQYHQYHQGTDDQYALNHPNFENSSVTPSQSASQVYQPNHARDSMMYNAPFDGIAEGDGNHAVQQKANGNVEEYDSDEEDWQRSFGGGNGENAQPLMVHQGGGANLPAPHQLDMRAGTEADFVPHMFPVHSTRNNNAQQLNASPDLNHNQSATPAPTPPAKDENKRLSRSSTMKKPKRAENEDSVRSNPSQLNYVSMPPIPTAPSLNSNGVNLAPVPTAPRLYMPGASGAQDDSSDEEEHRRTVAHRGGGSDWNSRHQTRREEDGNSSDEGTAKAGHPDRNRKSSFFGKMGRLFKGDPKKSEEARTSPNKDARAKRSNSQWDTRTDVNIRNNFHVNDPSSVQRRQSVLSRPLVPTQEDSSDEEQVDERNLIRNVNKGPPLWQTKKSNSDIGTSKSLIMSGKRPSTLRRTPSATINAGPLSWKAHQEAEEKRRPESMIAQASAPDRLSRSSTMISTTPSKKKKKKVKAPASNDGGSEIGTQATRTKPLATTGNRNSVVVTGDASSGIRRSDSLNYGSMRGAKEKDTLAKRSSKRLSAMSTQQIHGHGNKVGAMGSIDPSGKFATSNWVAKSNVNEEEEDKQKTTSATPVKPTPRHAVTGQTPKAATPKPPQVPTPDEPPKHVPQPSRTMSPPLKPALKHGTDLARSASAMSARSTGAPILPSIPTAPPPASTLLDKQSLSNANESNSTSLLSLEQDRNIDGTGRLNLSTLNEGDSSKDEGTVKVPRTALPRIDMPASEPFKVELGDNKAKVTTPQKEGLPTFSNGDPLLTPNERKAYENFMSTGDHEDVKKVPGQPEGVTRTTVARASVGGGVLGPKNVPPAQQQPRAVPEEGAKVSHLPPKLSRSYSGDISLSDSSSDEEIISKLPQPADMSVKAIDHQHAETSIAPGTMKPASILSNTHLQAAHGGDGNERSPEGSGVGSTVSRRKSVRMAPDVKLPPETPPADVPKAFGTQQSSSRNESASKLSSRIAPPPPAPPRMTAHAERPVDLGAMQERTGWSTRIGRSRVDDSSDEENDEEGEDAYAAARRNFGSISKSWGKAMGKSEAEESNAGSKAGSVTKKKKRKSAAPTNSGYNPAVPLPAGLEVVGRSASRKGK